MLYFKTQSMFPIMAHLVPHTNVSLHAGLSHDLTQEYESYILARAL